MHYRQLPITLAAWICVIVGISGQSVAQQSGMVDSQESRRQFNTGPAVQTANLTTPARVLNQSNAVASQKQIRVQIRYLMVDDENRAAIYDQLAPESVKFQTQKLPGTNPPSDFAATGSVLKSSRTVTTTSCVATSVLSKVQRDAILGQVAQSDGAKVSAAPSLILLHGVDGQLDDIVQRPFLVAFPKTDVDVQNDLPEDPLKGRNSSIQVVDEGSSFRVRATSLDEGHVHLASELINKTIVGVEETRVYGKAEAAVLQRPIHQVETAVTTAKMRFGETLLIDPYIAREVEVVVDRGVPILGKIPYVNRSFKNTARSVTKTNWIVLVEPTIEQSAVHQVSLKEIR